MRHVFLYLFIFLCPTIYAQNEDLLNQMRGFKHRNDLTEFNISGHDIYTMHRYEAFNKKGIKNILNYCGIKNIIAQYTDSTLSRQNLVIESNLRSRKNSKMSGHTLLYIFPREKQGLDIVIFQTLMPLNKEICGQFLEAYFANDLSKYITEEQTTNNIDFVGRNIELSGSGEWQSPNNLQYGNQGQISWSTFESLNDANEYIRLCMEENSAWKSVLTEEVEVLFEDIPTTATRIVYKAGNGWNKNRLAVYYVATKVRDTYIGCILSNYISNDQDYSLASLLQEVMILDNQSIELTEEEDDLNSLQSENYIPVYNREYGDEFEDRKRAKYGFVMLHTGAWIPLGQMQNAIGVSPSIGARLMWLPPGASRLSFGIGFDMMILTNRKPFNLHIDGTTVQTRASSIAAMVAAYIGYDHRIKKNLYFDQYLGIGAGSLETKERDGGVDENGNDTYYSVSAFNLCLGGKLRYKSFGVFAEYHYIPFNRSKKLDRSFGNSSIVAGLSWRF